MPFDALEPGRSSRLPQAGRASFDDSNAEANAKAVGLIAACRPVVRELVTARDALGLAEGELGHAGPPFAAGQRPSPVVLEALAGAALHEGWAGTLDDARAMVRDGRIQLRSNHAMRVVSPMAGVVRPSQRLFRLEDRTSAAVSYATLAEKGRRVLRFGHYDAKVAAGLKYVETTIAEAIARALPAGGLDVLPLVARAVELGDDVHQRNVGGMLAFLAALGPLPTTERDWLAGHPQHFLNYAMAAAKMSLDRAAGVEGSSLVTAIARNGIDCGVQVAGLPGRWFNAPASLPVGDWFDGRGPADTHADLGDSAIMEAFGLGGCIAHASPEIAAAMGRSWPEAQDAGEAMRAHFIARRGDMAPALAGVDGVGLGLDAARVEASGRGVRIHTGVAHADGRSGWIGIGVAEAPLACFVAAMAALRSADANAGAGTDAGAGASADASADSAARDDTSRIDVGASGLRT